MLVPGVAGLITARITDPSGLIITTDHGVDMLGVEDMVGEVIMEGTTDGGEEIIMAGEVVITAGEVLILQVMDHLVDFMEAVASTVVVVASMAVEVVSTVVVEAFMEADMAEGTGSFTS